MDKDCAMPNALPALPEDLAERRAKAWIGDAVLALRARQWILETYGSMSAERFTNLTSNAFLATLGNPTNVEAQIGLLFERDGLEAACQYIDEHIIPQFQKQQRNRERRN